jgi:hypothetical protein
MNHNEPSSAAAAAQLQHPAGDISRMALATRIHDLLLNEIGQDVDVALMLGPLEYSRAVLSLCRYSGNSLLADLGAEFERLSQAEARTERASQQRRFGSLQFGQARGVAGRAQGGSAYSR